MNIIRTIRIILGSADRSTTRKIVQLTIIGGIWATSIALIVTWTISPYWKAGGWAILAWVSILLALLVSSPSWYRRF
jgi:hypothetical protein